jgi:hypothetical protein
LKWPLRISPRGPITIQSVKNTLERAGRDYVDDSKTVPESLG